ncbi:hypothetical protein BVC80_9073g92 [Macleaya cordata]|uniref:Pathogenic type III effector avirulence factor Avr cleavage site n=1 Tax=Macleaya cordata TaxID=56857 RepID=A0A200PTV1_MACCD|nr:hypothetical protein BVC80_9073g92 [Macleaya cordata]
MDEFKRNQIPAFGNWDYSDGLPITQYFESARQAGLLRYSCGERDLYGGEEFLYPDYHDLRKPAAITVVPRRKTKGATGEKRYNQVYNKEHKKQGRVYDVTEPARHHSGPTYPQQVDQVPQQPPPPPPRAPKAVDEDLYKIPPELLYKQPKRKKMFGIFACLVPNCAA